MLNFIAGAAASMAAAANDDVAGEGRTFAGGWQFTTAAK